MSAPPPPPPSDRPAALPPPPNPELAAIAVGVVQLALIVAGWGLLALAVDRDPVDDPALGPLVGPAMALASGIVTWLAARPVVRGGRPGASALIAAVGSLVVMLAIGGLGALLGHADAAAGLAAIVRFALGGFVALAALLAGATVAGAWLVTRPRAAR